MLEVNRREAMSVIGAAATLMPASTVAAADPRVLPPGMSRTTFSRAVAELQAIVGAEWVFATPESMISYSKLMVPDCKNVHVACGAVAPNSTEEVQRIVQVANRYKLPLWTVSTGKNMGYGMTSPASTGQMVLDLKRMNRIIEVDPVLCTALVEPGVTYQDLANYIAERQLPLWIDCPGPGPIASPMGNALERGGGFTPYGDHFQTQCGLEVVLPDGQLMRTGQGSVRNSKNWQCYKWGYGPYVDGLFSQSNLGIVTKMGLWLMPAPPAYKPFLIRIGNDEGLARVVETTRDLQLRGVVMNGGLICSALYNLGMYNRRSDIWDRPESIPADALKTAANAASLGMWNCYVALYGTEESIALAEPMLRSAYHAAGGEVLTRAEMGDNPYFHHHSEFMRGGLNLSELGLVRWRGSGGGIAWFCPTSPARVTELDEQLALSRRIIAKYGFDYVTAWVVAGRALHLVMPLLYDKSDLEEERRAEDCFRELVSEFGQRGFAPYRVGTHAMDLVAQQYGEVNRVFNTRIKRAIDPNGILAPGKSGIS